VRRLAAALVGKKAAASRRTPKAPAVAGAHSSRGMPLLRFRHPQQDAFAFLVLLAFGEIAINLCCLNFGPPIAPDDFDRFLSILRSVGWVVVLHRAQSVPAMDAAKGAVAPAFICWAVITTATEPIINPAPKSVRNVNFSPANAVPSKTATTGFTYA